MDYQFLRNNFERTCEEMGNENLYFWETIFTIDKNIETD